MKISVSLSADDLEFLDAETLSGNFPSRSAVVGAALALMRQGSLVAVYDQAFAEWEQSGEAEVWDATVGDGLA